MLFLANLTCLLVVRRLVSECIRTKGGPELHVKYSTKQCSFASISVLNQRSITAEESGDSRAAPIRVHTTPGFPLNKRKICKPHKINTNNKKTKETNRNKDLYKSVSPSSNSEFLVTKATKIRVNLGNTAKPRMFDLFPICPSL